MTPVVAGPVAYPLTIYYDASCPLCRSEMSALKSRDRADRLRLVDCSTPAFADASVQLAGLSQGDLMHRVHARDAAGTWLRGVDVFEAAYRAVGLRVLAFVWGCRLWRPLLNRAYPWVAQHRQLLSRLGLPIVVRAGISALGGRGSACETGACALAADAALTSSPAAAAAARSPVPCAPAGRSSDTQDPSPAAHRQSPRPPRAA